MLSLVSILTAQSEVLPKVLQPGAATQAEAKRTGADVFKLLPSDLYKDPPGCVKDGCNPLGIRGGGSYYSFTSGSHSYNSFSQILIASASDIRVFCAFHGFFVDLGQIDLADIHSDSPDIKAFLSYKPPLMRDDYGKIFRDTSGMQLGPFIVSGRWIESKVGNTYLLRAINLEKADVAVAFRLLKRDRDGSVTIAWKKLADFPKPFVLSMSDEEMQEKVNAVIAKEGFANSKVLVKNNWLYFQGPYYDNDALIESAIRRKGIPFRGAGGVIQ